MGPIRRCSAGVDGHAGVEPADFTLVQSMLPAGLRGGPEPDLETLVREGRIRPPRDAQATRSDAAQQDHDQDDHQDRAEPAADIGTADVKSSTAKKQNEDDQEHYYVQSTSPEERQHPATGLRNNPVSCFRSRCGNLSLTLIRHSGTRRRAGEGLITVLAKISIGGRLRLAFGTLFVTLILVGGAALYQSAQMNAVANDIVRNRLPSYEALARIAVGLERFRQLQAAGVLANTPEQKTAIPARQSESLSEIRAAIQDYQLLIDSGEEATTLFPAVEAAWKDYNAQSAVLASATDKSAAAEIFNIRLQPPIQRLRAALKADLNYNGRMAKLGGAQTDASYALTIWVIGIGIAVAATSRRGVGDLAQPRSHLPCRASGRGHAPACHA